MSTASEKYVHFSHFVLFTYLHCDFAGMASVVDQVQVGFCSLTGCC